MGELDEKPEAAAGRPKCPAATKAAIRQAIALHIREHGRGNWALLRERPEFAPWIGEAAGESGRRKFFRWVDAVAERLPKSRTRPHEAREVNAEQMDWAKAQAQAIADGQALVVAPSPRHLASKGARALEGYTFLARHVADSFDDLERVRALALVDDPAGLDGKSAVDPKLLLKAVQAKASLVQTATGLYREYNASWERAAFQDAIIDLVEDKLADHPALRDAVIAGLTDLANEFGGVPPQGGSR